VIVSRVHPRRHRGRMKTRFIIAGVLGCVAIASAKEPDGKIPLTTSSDEARQLYIKARDLNEKLKITDAHKVFEQAVAKDKTFALAYLGLAQTSQSPKEFFEALHHAVDAAAKASEPEQLLIKAVDAGANGDPAHQKEYLIALATKLPRDERAQLQLGIYYMGTQDYPSAITALEAAIKVDPAFAAPYNQIGYAYRFTERYGDAEKAFKKYVELIPNDPNPYDSYGELLMKIGRFDDSIASYRKALDHDSHFVASLIGIGNDQMFQGKFADARKTFTKMDQIARNVAEHRQATAWIAESYIHEGAWDKALAQIDRMSALTTELPQRANDDNFAGNTLLAADRPDEAAARFKRQVETMNKSTQPETAKETTRRNHVYDEARVALAKKDLATAKAKAAEFAKQVAAKNIPFEVRLSHQLNGVVATAEGNHKLAIAELSQANEQDPRALYELAVAYAAAGDAAKAKATAGKVVDFNALALNLGYVRGKAKAMVK
jgi:tetratricopeptide (TPR) repeat protein